MARDIRDASPDGYAELTAAYPDGDGGVDLQPFFDLITIHELAHAFETLGDLRLPTSWLSEIFVNLALHAFVAARQPISLPTLETLPRVGAASRTLADRMRTEGYSTLEELEEHYPGGDAPMSGLNYVVVSVSVDAARRRDVRDRRRRRGHTLLGLLSRQGPRPGRRATAVSLAPLLNAEVSVTLGGQSGPGTSSATLRPLSRLVGIRPRSTQAGFRCVARRGVSARLPPRLTADAKQK